jgi:hypothetical protein
MTEEQPIDRIADEIWEKAMDPDRPNPYEDMSEEEYRNSLSVLVLSTENLIFHEQMPYINYYMLITLLYTMHRQAGLAAMVEALNVVSEIVYEADRVRQNGPQTEAD